MKKINVLSYLLSGTVLFAIYLAFLVIVFNLNLIQIWIYGIIIVAAYTILFWNYNRIKSLYKKSRASYEHQNGISYDYMSSIDHEKNTSPYYYR